MNYYFRWLIIMNKLGYKYNLLLNMESCLILPYTSDLKMSLESIPEENSSLTFSMREESLLDCWRQMTFLQIAAYYQ